MLDQIYITLLSEPRRLIALAKSLGAAGAFLLVLGAMGRVIAGVSAISRGFGKQVAEPVTLAEIYPSIPTWFVPETVYGCIPAFALIGTGLYLLWFAQRLQRAYF